MAKYMVSWQFPGDNRNEAIERFTEGSRMQPPEGVVHIARWHSVEGDAGWGVVETSDPKHLADWLLHWSDLLSYQVTPVISDEELGELFKKHGF